VIDRGRVSLSIVEGDELRFHYAYRLVFRVVDVHRRTAATAEFVLLALTAAIRLAVPTADDEKRQWCAWSRAMTVLKKAVAVTVVPASLLARFGLSAFIAMMALAAVLVVAVFGFASWVINDGQRSDRVEKLLKAARARAEVPASASAVAGTVTKVRRRRWPWWHTPGA
jgi:hypothetical protein